MSRTRNVVYNSRCADETYRGNAQQLVDRYTNLANSAEDPIKSSLYLQYAHHYAAIINENLNNK